MPAAENDTKRKCWKRHKCRKSQKKASLQRQQSPHLKLNKSLILVNHADGKRAGLVYCLDA
nr:MAG TPA: hypothetical protein [Caudoviricetes sp.]